MSTATKIPEAVEISDPVLPSVAATARARSYVCMVAYTFYPFDARVRREAETLAAHGFQVRCLTTKTGRAKRAKFLVEGVEVRELPIPKYRGKSKLAYLASYIWFLCAVSVVCVELLIKGELDILHVHNLPDFLVFAGLLPRLLGRKVVLDVHDSVPETFATKFSNASLIWKALCLEERLSAAAAHRVICVNEPQREALVARGIPQAKTFVSMNVPDPRIFGRPADVAFSHSTGVTFNLVYHGTMANRLGVDLVIRAVARLRGRVPNVRLHLWGNGDDLVHYRDLASELEIDELIDFRPEGFPLEALPSNLRAMHVGVVGNRRSAAADLMLPVKLLEYVSLQIPAVVPRLKTIQHYFSDDMVSYYEPEDVESLAESVFRLSQTPDLRCRQAERAHRFLVEHGWSLQGPELVTLYRELMEKRRP